MICNNLSINKQGHLCFTGVDTTVLAKKYGTPLYLMDENRIRERCRTYVSAMKGALGENASPLYASKAASFKQIYRIMKEEGMGIDVVSSGEIYTAASVGFPMENAYFHSNNKTDDDIAFAMTHGVGYFVVDNEEELKAINRIATEKSIHQKILLRLTPGIDPHTYEEVATGKVDSKFGSAIETGQAKAITEVALSLSHIKLMGFHCHVGSQVFDSNVFVQSADVMLKFVQDIEIKLGFHTEILDLGGGYGVRYLDSDPQIDIAENIRLVGAHIRSRCEELGIDLPAIHLETGRSIVADAGMTLYTVGTIKRIPGYKNYVSVDGGMADNPRYALYKSPYTVMLANRAECEDETFLCSLVGRCCESGDIIQENISLPANTQRGDLIAVLTTGAYNYSMASNYNRLTRPPIVMLKDGVDYLSVKRESLADLCANDI